MNTWIQVRALSHCTECGHIVVVFAVLKHLCCANVRKFLHKVPCTKLQRNPCLHTMKGAFSLNRAPTDESQTCCADTSPSPGFPLFDAVSPQLIRNPNTCIQKEAAGCRFLRVAFAAKASVLLSKSTFSFPNNQFTLLSKRDQFL